MNKIYVILPVIILTSSCVGVSIEDYYAKLTAIAGENAIDCSLFGGTRATTLQTNTCVADSFQSNLPFYASYIQQGFDSYSVNGFAYDSLTKSLFVIHYSNIQPPYFPSSSLTVNECKGATLQGTVDSHYSTLFTCQ